MNYYSKETIDTLRSYRVQIIFLFVSILAILLSITVLRDLYYQTLNKNNNLANQIFIKSKLVALIYTFVSFYFLYVTYQAYVKNKTKSNYIFVIAALLFFIASFLRYINISQNDVSNAGDVI